MALGGSKAGGPTLFGLPAKHVSLVSLCFQNSALILVMHYSRIMPQEGDHRYFASTAVFLSEVLKGSLCLACCVAETSQTLAPSTPNSVIFEQIYNSVFSGDGWKLIVPAVLYTLQNTLQYVAVGNLDAVHFQVLSQFKILAAAVFSVIILRRTIGPKRWLALLILTLGVSVVCLPHEDAPSTSDIFHHSSDHFFPRTVNELGQSAAKRAARVAQHLTKRDIFGFDNDLEKRANPYPELHEEIPAASENNYTVGLVAALVAAASSGLAGVYFEKMLKESASVSIWTRNVQLSFYSLFPALFLGVFVKDGAEMREHGFFDGYNWVVWVAIILQAMGGVLSSLCINYADNIAKNFAASISIVVSFVFSVLFFHFVFGPTFVIGTGFVMFATYLYSRPDRKSRPPPISIAKYEKPMIDPAYTPRNSGHRLTLDPLDAIRGLQGLSTSRPASPMLHHHRIPSERTKDRGD